jgi:DNA-binding NarL/FixJ family response regulator
MAGGQPVIRVVLVEDRAAIRAEIERVLARFAERVSLVHSFADGESLVAAVAARHADRAPATFAVALVDLGLPGISGFDVIEALSAHAPDVRAVALTIFDDEASVLQALQAGAYGYLLKDEPAQRLVQAIEEAAAGEHPISSRVAGFLVARVAAERTRVLLSDRETELASSLARGLTYAECATQMGIALGTVQEYVKRLYRKLDVNSRHEVRQWVSRHRAIR